MTYTKRTAQNGHKTHLLMLMMSTVGVLRNQTNLVVYQTAPLTARATLKHLLDPYPLLPHRTNN